MIIGEYPALPPAMVRELKHQTAMRNHLARKARDKMEYGIPIFEHYKRIRYCV